MSATVSANPTTPEIEELLRKFAPFKSLASERANALAGALIRPIANDELTEVTGSFGGAPNYERMTVSQTPPTAEDLRHDAHNAVRLADFARSDREKAMLLNAAGEFLNKAAELEAVTAVTLSRVPSVRHARQSRGARLTVKT